MPSLTDLGGFGAGLLVVVVATVALGRVAGVGREAVRESLLPNLDQTRSIGLVTLPGAFVDAFFTRLFGRTPYVGPGTAK